MVPVERLVLQVNLPRIPDHIRREVAFDHFVNFEVYLVANGDTLQETGVLSSPDILNVFSSLSRNGHAYLDEVSHRPVFLGDGEVEDDSLEGLHLLQEISTEGSTPMDCQFFTLKHRFFPTLPGYLKVWNAIEVHSVVLLVAAHLKSGVGPTLTHWLEAGVVLGNAQPAGPYGLEGLGQLRLVQIVAELEEGCVERGEDTHNDNLVEVEPLETEGRPDDGVFIVDSVEGGVIQLEEEAVLALYLKTAVCPACRRPPLPCQC